MTMISPRTGDFLWLWIQFQQRKPWKHHPLFCHSECQAFPPRVCLLNDGLSDEFQPPAASGYSSCNQSTVSIFECLILYGFDGQDTIHYCRVKKFPIEEPPVTPGSIGPGEEVGEVTRTVNGTRSLKIGAMNRGRPPIMASL